MITKEQAKKIMKQYINENSNKLSSIEDIIEDDFISKFLPQQFEYKTSKNFNERKSQFTRVLDLYKDFILLTRQFSNARNLEIMAILFYYDIVKNNQKDNKELLIERYIQSCGLNIYPEFSQEIYFYIEHYSKYIEEKIEAGENVCDIINNILTKKFAFNLYSNNVMKQRLKLGDKIDKIKDTYEYIKTKYNIICATDVYENLIKLMNRYCKGKDLISDIKKYQKIQNMITSYFNLFDFPEVLKKSGFTPESILIQSSINTSKYDSQSPQFVFDILKILNQYGNNLGECRRNQLFTLLLEKMEQSAENLCLHEDFSQIRDFIKLYSKVKYSGKMNFSYRIKNPSSVMESPCYDENAIVENIENLIFESIKKYCKTDFKKGMEFIKEIPEIVTGESGRVCKYKFKKEVLPEIMGIQLSNEDKFLLDGKTDAKSIISFLYKKRNALATPNNNLKTVKNEEK